MKRIKLTKLQWLVHAAAPVPLAGLVWFFLNDQLGVNPIQELTFRTGKVTLVFLLLALACTPLNTLFHFRQALTVRRALGLYTFFYASVHFLTFVGLDYGFNPELLYEAIFEKRYALVGFATFLILLPLALTSTRGWMRRLGKNWKRLHRMVYLAAPLAIVHFTWVVKSDIREPLAYGLVVALLLAARLPPIKRLAGSLTHRASKKGNPPITQVSQLP